MEIKTVVAHTKMFNIAHDKTSPGAEQVAHRHVALGVAERVKNAAWVAGLIAGWEAVLREDGVLVGAAHTSITPPQIAALATSHEQYPGNILNALNLAAAVLKLQMHLADIVH